MSGANPARPHFALQTRAPALQILQGRRPLDDQALTPFLHALELFRFAYGLLAARAQRGPDGLEVEIAHEPADVLSLARTAAAAGDAAGEADCIGQGLGKIERVELGVAQGDQGLPEILGLVRGALARALARPLVAAGGVWLVWLVWRGGHELRGYQLFTPAGYPPVPCYNPAMPPADDEKGIPQLQDVVSFVLEEAGRRGASQCEADASVSQGLSVSVRLREVDTVEYQRDRGLGVTVYFGKRKGSASTSDLSLQAVRDTVEKASAIARFTAEDPYAGLVEPEALARDIPDLDLDHPWRLAPEDAIELARRCEEAGLAVDTRIANSDGASVGSQRHIGVYGNSHGFLGGYAGTSHSLSCSVIGQQGDEMQRDYWYTSSRDPADLESAELIGRKAGERTVARLGSRKLSTRKAPVAFVPEMARGLFKHFIGAIRGASQYRKASFLLGAAGEGVFPAFVQIHERPHILKGLASAPFDAEGATTRDRDLVRDGVLDGYIMGSYSARKLGLKTTGNAGGVHNLIVAAPGRALDTPSFLQRLGSGLLVTELMGHGVNAVTGDYSRGASGFWVEKGVVAYPVHEVTIAGNLRQMFRDVAALGGDIDERGGIRTGSVLIGEMTIAGE